MNTPGQENAQGEGSPVLVPIPAAKYGNRTRDLRHQEVGIGNIDNPSSNTDATQDFPSRFPTSSGDDALNTPRATKARSVSQEASAPTNQSTEEIMAATLPCLQPAAYDEIGHDAVRAIQEALAHRQQRASKPPLFAPAEMARHAFEGGEGFARRLTKGAGDGAHVRLSEGLHCFDKVWVAACRWLRTDPPSSLLRRPPPRLAAQPL